MTATVSLAIVQATIARAIAGAPEQRGRIERGAALIAIGAVEQVADDQFAVTSQTNGIVIYAVRPDSCECADHARHPELRCKHQWAARIVLAARMDQDRQDARQREQAARARFTADRVAIAASRAYARAS